MGDITISGPAIIVIGVLLAALVSTVVGLFKLLLLAKDSSYAEAIKIRDVRIVDLVHERDNYHDAAIEAMSMAEVAVNKLRKVQGKPPLDVVLPVVPEHRSPVTAEQQNVADMQTLRARAAVLARELDLPPRGASLADDTAGSATT